jgi:long-chain acyl-CoA synthetase
MLNNSQISTLFRQIINNNSHEIFIFDSLENKQYSYAEFWQSVQKIILILQKEGLNNGDIVAVIADNSYSLLIIYFAALMMNLIVAPIDPLKGKQEIAYILEVLEYKKIIHPKDYLPVSEGSILFEDIKENLNNKVTITNNFEQLLTIDFNKPYLLSFTSGSTGKPKGVIHSFSNLFESALAFNISFNFNKTNIFYHNLPMTYMAGILNLIFLPFICQSKIVISSRFNIASMPYFWDFPVKYKVNTFWFIPTIISLLLKLDRGEKGINYAKKIKIIGCVGTAPLSEKNKIEFEQKYQINLFESYGLSELLFIATNSPNYPVKNNKVGKILKNVDVKIAFDEEILVKVPWQYLGYYKMDSIEYFAQNHYKTGDIGLLDDEDYLKITGRKKDLIIKGGINLCPKSIEEVINKQKIFDDFVILGKDDQILGEKIICYYVCQNNLEIADKLKELNKYIYQQLGTIYTIDEFKKISQIPLNLNGKVDKLKLKQTENVLTN